MAAVDAAAPVLRAGLLATSDWPCLRAALDAAGLPCGDLLLPGRRFFRFASDSETACYGGLEGDGPEMLLRSVVVPPSARGRGAGQAIVRALEAEAARLGAVRLHLLTTTAAAFFHGLGYRPGERAAAPPAIAATAQFTSLCPATAAYLVKRTGSGMTGQA